eukprot:jgi/Mesvir1/1777/Mv09625-RA.1
MPKKLSSNPKAEERRAAEHEKKSAKQAADAKAKEDAEWEAAANPKSKAAKKKEEEAERKAEAAAKKAEACALAEAEERALEQGKNKKAEKVREGTMKRRRRWCFCCSVNAAVLTRVTHHHLAKQREELKKKEEAVAEEAAQKRERMVREGEYHGMVMMENKNRDILVAEARSVDEAIAALTMTDGDDALPDKHPERRAKAAWKAFEAENMPILKEENPGLKRSQYNEMLWKIWQKSPLNPMNQKDTHQGASSERSIQSNMHVEKYWVGQLMQALAGTSPCPRGDASPEVDPWLLIGDADCRLVMCAAGGTTHAVYRT